MEVTLNANAINFIKLIIEKMFNDFRQGSRYKASQISILENILNISLELRVYEKINLIDILSEIKILAWYKTLKKEKIKYKV
jgi:hypothetical protein